MTKIEQLEEDFEEYLEEYQKNIDNVCKKY